MKRLCGWALLLVLMACGPTEVVDEPSGQTAESGDSGGGKVAEPTKVTASVGSSIELKGNMNGSTMRVTMVQVVDPATPKDQFLTPSDGSRYVAVQVRLENIGSAVYSDSPENGFKIIDSSGQQFASTFAEISAGPGFGGTATINTGDTRMGFITAELPNSSKPAKIQFALDSGFGPQAGEWSVA